MAGVKDGQLPDGLSSWTAGSLFLASWLFALFGDGKAPPNSFKTFQCPFEFMEKRDLRFGYRPFMPGMVAHAGNHDTWEG